MLTAPCLPSSPLLSLTAPADGFRLLDGVLLLALPLGAAGLDASVACALDFAAAAA